MMTPDVSHDRFLTLMSQSDEESLHERLDTIPLRHLHDRLAASREDEEATLFGSLYKAKARLMAENRNHLFLVSVNQTVDCIIGGIRSNTPSWTEQHVKKLEGFTQAIEGDTTPEKSGTLQQLLKIFSLN